MIDWILGMVILSFVIYKLGQLIELDIGRGWLKLKFSDKPLPELPQAKSTPRRKRIKN
jgi:hypothetical protein